MKRLLYMSDYSDIGGGETSLLQVMLFQIANSEYEPELLLLGRGPLYALARKHNIPVVVIGTMLRRGWVKFLPLPNPVFMAKLLLLLIRRRYSVIHANSVGVCLANALIPAKLLRTCLFATCHGPWDRPYGVRGRVLSFFLAKMFFVSDYVRSYSTTSNSVTTYLPHSRKVVDRNKVAELRRTLNLGDAIVVGVIGRYQLIKNQHGLVRFMDKFMARHPYYRFKIVFVGSAIFSKSNVSYENLVRKTVEESSSKASYVLLPMAEDIENYIELLDFVIVPSLSETFSMVTVEAMSQGKPVLATRKGGPAEIIQDGVSGFLYDPLSYSSFEGALLRALQCDRDILSQNAVVRSLDFTPDRVALQMTNAYREADNANSVPY